MTLFKWSRVAATDATADATINWAEGMAPSGINDSGRAMMAAVAKFRDDISGAIVTGGTSTAYTVASYQAFDSLAHLDGQMLAFTPHATNTGTATLNVDGLGAKPLRGSPSVELPSGSLILGTPYVATYSNTDAVWYLQGGLSNPYNIPLGGGLPYFGSTAPNSSFIFPFGQSISRTTYAALFSLLGTTYGTGDGSTTFNVPDLRGRVIAGKDDMGGVTASRLSPALGATSTTLGGAGGAANVALSTGNLPAYTPSGSVSTTTTTIATSNPMAPSGTTSGTLPASGNSTPAVSNTSLFLGSTSTSTFTGTAQGGSSAPFNIIPPTLVVNFILRII